MNDIQESQLAMAGIDPLEGKRFVVRKRDGRDQEFNEARIYIAVESAFKAVRGIGNDEPLPGVLEEAVQQITNAVVKRVLSDAAKGKPLEVETIQDAVEDRLMLEGHLTVARRYILYREQRRLSRAIGEGRHTNTSPQLTVVG